MDLTSAQRGHAERRRADLGVRSLPRHGRLHLHVAALRGAERRAGQVLDGGVRVLAVQRAAARRHQVLQLCSHQDEGRSAVRRLNTLQTGRQRPVHFNRSGH